MARRSHERGIKPSLLDRLIDDEPRNRAEAQDRRAHSLKELKDSVRRDLEALLNSRRSPPNPRSPPKSSGARSIAMGCRTPPACR